jgi:RNA polymerase sigma factor for flagellar operon FliA
MRLDDTWTHFLATRDPAARNALITANLHLAKQAAYKWRNVRANDREDLLGVAHLALCASVDTWQPARGMAWEAYARCKLQQGLVDHLRSWGWSKKSTRKEAEGLEEAEEELTAQLQRKPTQEELAEHLGMDVDQLAALQAKLHQTPWSVDSLHSRALTETGEGAQVQDLIPANTPTPEEELLTTERAAWLDSITQRLPPKWRLVLDWKLDGLSQKEMAQRVGTHESRQSQVIKALQQRAVELSYQRVLPW